MPSSRAAHATAWPWLPALAGARAASRSRAASMSARVGAVVVANAEHLLQDLTNRRQRVEPSVLHVAQEPSQLVALPHRLLEMAPRTRRGDLEDLGRQISAPPPLELAFGLEPGAVLGDLLPERVDAFTAHRLGEHD